MSTKTVNNFYDFGNECPNCKTLKYKGQLSISVINSLITGAFFDSYAKNNKEASEFKKKS